jgi:hypothetical protein
VAKTGKKYWQTSGSPKKYRLLEEKNSGGVNVLTDRLTKKQATLYTDGYNDRVGKGNGKLKVP